MDNFKPENFGSKISFIWSLAEYLRGDYKQSEYGRVILPLTVLRRLDCVLKPVKQLMLETYEKYKDKYKEENIDFILRQTIKSRTGKNIYFYNISRFDFEKLKDDPENVNHNLINYINGFDNTVKEIISHFHFDIDRLHKAGLLYFMIEKFSEIDLHPDVVSNTEMGYIFEELIRRFSEQSNETAGEHFTPREVVWLMVHLLFIRDSEILSQKGVVRKLYDPAAGTGGMLSLAEMYVREHNSDARLEVYGQEINPESYAICKADMLIKGQNPNNIIFGNSFTQDGFPGEKFDYMLTNPPFGVDWNKYADPIKEEHETEGYSGRFGAGLPRKSDGQLLFLQHMLSKMKNDETGTRLAIVFNGSPLFTGDAGSGESEIRRWIIENDWLEAIIALPNDLFYNTGIATYIWVLTNRKSPERKGKIQLVDATDQYQKMRRSLGQKRNELSKKHIDYIVKVYGDFLENEQFKIFNNEEFGYRKITIERPLKINYAVNEERLEKVKAENSFQKLAVSKKKDPKKKEEEEREGRKLQEAIINALKTIPEGPDNGVYRNYKKFEKLFEETIKKTELSLKPGLKKAILRALSERDEEAPIVTDGKGNPVPDPDLRDTERVPLGEDIYEYFEREVKPHVPDAWINEEIVDHKDGKVGKVGYEINFNRYFYKYEPPRPLEEIRAEIKELGEEISELLQEVVR
jgi:type I restriction enzyme M protein